MFKTTAISYENVFTAVYIDDTALISSDKGKLNIQLYNQYNKSIFKMVNDSIISNADLQMLRSVDGIIIKNSDNSVYADIYVDKDAIIIRKALLYYNGLKVIVLGNTCIALNVFNEHVILTDTVIRIGGSSDINLERIEVSHLDLD